MQHLVNRFYPNSNVLDHGYTHMTLLLEQYLVVEMVGRVITRRIDLLQSTFNTEYGAMPFSYCAVLAIPAIKPKLL